MSDTVHYKGKLQEIIKLGNETLEEQCKRILDKELDDDYISYQEYLLDECYQKYIVHDNILYSVEKQNVAQDQDIFNISYSGCCSFNFEVRYYNDSCSFDEAIEHAFDRRR